MLFGSSEIATRSLSLIFYVLTVFVMVEFLVHVLRYPARKAAIWGVLAGLFTPLLVYYGFETRAYSLLSFLSILSIYALCTHKWKMYLVAMLAGLFTHYLMCLMLLIHIFIYGSGLVGRHSKLSLVRLFVLPVVGIGVWLGFSTIMKWGQSSTGFWIPHPTITTLLTAPAILLTGFDAGWGFAYDLAPLTLIITCVIGIPLLLRYHTSKVSWVLLLTSLGLVGAVFFISVLGTNSLFISRYLILASPPFVLLLVIQLHRFKGIFQIMWLLSLLIVLWHFQVINIAKRHKEDIGSQINALKQNSRTSDYLLVASELDYHVAQVYWHDSTKVKIIGKKYEEIPEYVGKVLISPDAVIATNPCTATCTAYVLDQSRQIYVMHDTNLTE